MIELLSNFLRILNKKYRFLTPGSSKLTYSAEAPRPSGPALSAYYGKTTFSKKLWIVSFWKKAKISMKINQIWSSYLKNSRNRAVRIRVWSLTFHQKHKDFQIHLFLYSHLFRPWLSQFYFYSIFPFSH
jgi:hypothetical protein